MNFNLCPTCLADNTDDARFCRRCGQVLASDTVPQPLSDRPTQFLPGGLWLDDLEPAAGEGDALTITLRSVESTPRRAPPPPPPPVEPMWGDDAPLPALDPADGGPESTIPDTLRDLPPGAAAQVWPPLPPVLDLPPVPAPPTEPPVLALPELKDIVSPPRAPAPPPGPAPLPAPAAPPAVAPGLSDAELDAKRAARRASVRRSRLRALARSTDLARPQEILVIDRSDIERGILCGLLQAFGFSTHSVSDATQALPLLEATEFTAVFADLAIDASDGGAGIEFARRLRERQPKPLFVLVSPPLSPVDRVRAGLTGCDDIVEKRVTRGSVARVLDVHGIPLPFDARRT